MAYELHNLSCECADPGCSACRGLCTNKATFLLFRIDMQDADGVVFCRGCGRDALDCGLFTEAEDTQ